jgi:hypothetical protein
MLVNQFARRGKMTAFAAPASRASTGALALLAAAGALALGASPASASIVQYTDRAAFEAAAGLLTVETFNDFAPGKLAPLRDLGAFTVSTNNTAAIASGGDINGSNDLSVNLTADANGGLGTLTFTFDTRILAFGADFFSLNNGFVQRTFARVDGQIFNPLPRSPAFLGYISTTGFSTLSFSNQLGGGNNDAFQLDNLAYSTPGSVPEPASWALMLTGFLGAGAALRRGGRQAALAA